MKKTKNYKLAFVIMLIFSVLLIILALILKNKLKEQPIEANPSPVASATPSAAVTESPLSSDTSIFKNDIFTFQMPSGYKRATDVEKVINTSNAAPQTIITSASENEIKEFVNKNDNTAVLTPGKTISLFISITDGQVSETLGKDSNSQEKITTKNNLNATVYKGLSNSGLKYDQVVVDMGLGQNKMLSINNYYDSQDQSSETALNNILDSLKKN